MNLEIRSCKSCNFISFSKAFENPVSFVFQGKQNTTHLCPMPASPVVPMHHTSVLHASITSVPAHHTSVPYASSTSGPRTPHICALSQHHQCPRAPHICAPCRQHQCLRSPHICALSQMKSHPFPIQPHFPVCCWPWQGRGSRDSEGRGWTVGEAAWHLGFNFNGMFCWASPFSPWVGGWAEVPGGVFFLGTFYWVSTENTGYWYGPLGWIAVHPQNFLEATSYPSFLKSQALTQGRVTVCWSWKGPWDIKTKRSPSLTVGWRNERET